MSEVLYTKENGEVAGPIPKGDEEPDVSFHYIYRDFPYLHDHTFWEFLVVTQGEYRNCLNGKNYKMAQNDAFLIRPKDKHAVYSLAPEVAHLNIMFSFPFMEKTAAKFTPRFYDYLLSLPAIPITCSGFEVRKLLDDCAYLRGNIDPKTDVELVDSLIGNMVLGIVANQVGLLRENRPEWLSELLLEINNPNNAAWHVSDVLSAAPYSHSNLAKKFKEYMGMTVVEYLVKTKMGNAQEYLLQSDLSINEIAARLGYQSVTNFSATFRKEIGESPAQYRKSRLNKN